MDEDEVVSAPAPRPVRRARGAGASPAQRLLARSQDMDESVADYQDEDLQATTDQGNRVASARVAHIAPSKVRVYKLTPAGCTSLMVNVQSLGGPEGVLSHPAYSAVCFDCGRDDCGPGINDCPGRPPRKYRVCPVATCGKRVYDPEPTGRFLEEDGMTRDRDSGGDEGEIVNDEYAASTPEQRTKVQLDKHILGYHEDDAPRFGLQPLARRDLAQVAS